VFLVIIITMNLSPAEYDLGLGSFGCLPYEVREMILSHLLDARLDEGDYARSPSSQGDSEEQHSGDPQHDGGRVDLHPTESLEGLGHKRGYKLNTEILRASKAFYLEASNYLYNTNGMIRIRLPPYLSSSHDPRKSSPFFSYCNSEDAALLACSRFVLHVDVSFTDPERDSTAYIAVSSYQANTIIQYLSWWLPDHEPDCTIRIVLPRQTEYVRTATKFLTPWLWLQCYETVKTLSESEDAQVIRRTAKELEIARELSLHQWNVATSKNLDFIELLIANQSGHNWRVPASAERYCTHIADCVSPAPKPVEDFTRFTIHMRASFWSLVSEVQQPDGLVVWLLPPWELVKLTRWLSTSLRNMSALVAAGGKTDTIVQFHMKWIGICVRLAAECASDGSDWPRAIVLYTQAIALPFHPRAASDTVDCIRQRLDVAKSEYKKEFGHDWETEVALVPLTWP